MRIEFHACDIYQLSHQCAYIVSYLSSIRMYALTHICVDAAVVGNTHSRTQQLAWNNGGRNDAVQVTDDDIVDHENAYRGSDEERHDLLQLYARFKGDMKKVYSWLMCSRPVRFLVHANQSSPWTCT